MQKEHKIAIARILSDLIKSDNIIEPAEIDKYLSLQKEFDITQSHLIDAQSISLAEAIMRLKELDAKDKRVVEDSLLETANVDDACVSREALILLALKYVLTDEDDKYEILSCETPGSLILDKYVVYIEGYEDKDVNEDIQFDYDAIADKLQLWNFDFIYIPKLAEQFAQMDRDYIMHIIRYMNPSFSDAICEGMYNNLVGIKTTTFCNELLAISMKLPSLNTCQPSLLINFGTSVVPYCSKDSSGHTYTEFLRIRLDDTAYKEVSTFVRDYANYITEHESTRPHKQKDYFKYFGFYKALFDFLTRVEHDKKGKAHIAEEKLVVNLSRRKLCIHGTEINLSATHLTLYMLILQQMVKHGGLRKIDAKFSLSKEARDKKCKELTDSWNTISRLFNEADNYHFDYEANINNVRTYITRVKNTILKTHIPEKEHLYPKKVQEGNRILYTIDYPLDHIFIKVGEKLISVTEYWK